MNEYGMLEGCRRNKLFQFFEDQDRLCRISQLLGEIRLDIIDTMNSTRNGEMTVYELKMAEVADYLEEARDCVWSAIAKHNSALPDYIAEGYPRRI